MSDFSLAHPLGQQLETVHTAVAMGMITDKLREFPYLKVNYKDPMELGLDYGTIRIANWNTDNMTAAIFPLADEVDDESWKIVTDEGTRAVRQRVIVKDILGRGYSLSIDGHDFISSYVQFDVIDDGVVIVGEDAHAPIRGLGRFEGRIYDFIAEKALIESSLLPLVELAQAA